MSAPVIEVAGLRYRYPDGTPALAGVDFRLEEGESVCLAGPNGAGKSTLLMILAGLVEGEGRVLVRGRDPAGAPPDPSAFGLVFQDPDDQLFCPTVGEDLAFGPRNLGLAPEEAAGRAREALAAVGLPGFEGRGAHRLSGGEKKRAALAAVLACRPHLLACDEPWANLDARAARAVSRIISAFPGPRLVASQDLFHAAEVCGRLVILDGGIVAADGPMAELLRDAALLERHGLDCQARCRVCHREPGAAPGS